MYARVAVASDALATPDVPLLAANLIHETLLERINAHGRLVFGDDRDVKALLSAIRSGEDIPQDARTRWIETLSRLHKHGRIKVLHEHATLSDVTGMTNLRTEWGNCADLAIVASKACELLGISPDLGFVTEPGASPDVAITVAASQAPAIQRLRQLADSAIAAPGSSRDSFWRQVLEPLATDARSVTVLDAYLFKSTWDAADSWPSDASRHADHVVWLLEHLDAVMAPQSQVHLVGRVLRQGGPRGAQITADVIRTSWRPASTGRLRAVRVSLAETRRGERFPHDRHIRFSSGAAVEVSAGLDRLREEEIWDPDGMKWKYIWNADTLGALRHAEDRAMSYAHHPAAFVMQR